MIAIVFSSPDGFMLGTKDIRDIFSPFCIRKGAKRGKRNSSNERAELHYR